MKRQRQFLIIVCGHSLTYPDNLISSGNEKYWEALNYPFVLIECSYYVNQYNVNVYFLIIIINTIVMDLFFLTFGRRQSEGQNLMYASCQPNDPCEEYHCESYENGLNIEAAFLTRIFFT